MRKSILIVEANSRNNDLLQGWLLSLKNKTASIHQSVLLKDALSQRQGYEFIFLNLNLPDSKGIKSLTAIRKKFPESSVLILTSPAKEKEALAAIRMGAEDYFVWDRFDKRAVEKSISCIKEKKKRDKTIVDTSPDFERFFLDSPSPMWLYDSASFSFLAVNQAAIDNYGYSNNEFLKMTIWDIRPDEEKKVLTSAIKTIERQPGYTDAGYWRHKKKNGELFFVHVYTHETIYKGKKARMAISIDVNQRMLADKENKRLNEKIRRQKKEIDDILSSINEVIWSARADTYDLTYTNDACYNVYGYTAEEMKANRNIFFDAIHSDDKAKFMASFKELFARGQVTNEFRIHHKDGSVKYLTGTATLKKGTEGEPDIFSGVTIDITALKLAENALKEKVKQVENILESTTDAFLSLGRDWKINYVNKEFEKLFKKKRKELLGKNFWKCFPRLKDSSYYNYLQHAMDEWGSVHFEGPSESTGKILSVNLYPTDTGLAAYLKDITEEKIMQDKIINEEKKLRAIINNTEDIIWQVDTSLKTIAANQAYYNRIASLTSNKNFSKITIDDFEKTRIEKWKDYFERAFSGKLHKIIDKDVVRGRVTYEEISFNRIFDKNNNVVGLSCFSRDITEEKKLQDTIIKNEQNLRALINNTDNFMWSVDRNLRIISINEPFRNFIHSFTGKMPMPGDSIISDDFGPYIKNKWVQLYQRALAGERIVFDDEELIDGTQHHREKRMHPIIDDNGKIAGVSCFARDITEMKKHLILIEEQNKLLKEIAWIQSHKVRGPLTSIMGLVQLFNTETPGDTENRELIAGIQSASNTLDEIIREIVNKTNTVYNEDN